jgi:hypothetical protein
MFSFESCLNLMLVGWLLQMMRVTSISFDHWRSLALQAVLVGDHCRP